MNLFDILSAGKRDLNEENVSSFLAWLLDPGQSHGCGVLFLGRLLQVMGKENFEPWILGLDNIAGHRQLSTMKVDVIVEEVVETCTGKKRSVDIVVIMSNDEDTHILAIENKIRKEACDVTQLVEEFEGLKKSYDGAAISVIYLTPSKSSKFVEAFDALAKDITKLHLTWTSQEGSEEVSFVKILRDVLQDNSKAKIDPLSQEICFVLKSFVLFAERGFRSQASKSVSSGGGTRYYKGIVTGLAGIVSLFEEQGDVFIGFVGGVSALEEADLGKLEKRTFKWDNDLSGKVERNWIKAREFREIIEKKGVDLC